MERKINIDGKQYAVDILKQLNSLRKDKQHCDFTVRVGSEDIPVHKNVLSASSLYFKAMLSHDTLETQSGIVIVKEADPDCVKKCINFIYSGEAAVEEEKQGELMHVAHLMQLQRLCDGIALFLEDGLNSISFFVTKKLANMYNCKRLEGTCNQFALKNFRDIAKSEEFNELDEEYISFLMESKETKATEAVKCKALLQWTENDVTNRGKNLCHILGKLNLIKIPATYRTHLLKIEHFFNESMECYKLVTESLLASWNLKPKDVNIGQSEEIVVFNKTSKHLESFNPDDKSWTEMQAMNESMVGQTITAVYLDGYIYVFLSNKMVFRLDCSDSEGVWEKMANKQLSYGPVAILNGFIYTTDWQSQNTAMEQFNPSSNEWTQLPHKSQAVQWTTLVATEGEVFCIGGRQQQRSQGLYGNVSITHRPINIVEIFNPTTSTWSKDNSLNNARYQAASTVLNGIYVIGGTGGSSFSNAEFRCSTAKTWTVLSTPMKHARTNFSACNVDGKIYVVGGSSSGNIIEEYDPDAEEWKVVETIQNKNIDALASIAALV